MEEMRYCPIGQAMWDKLRAGKPNNIELVSAAVDVLNCSLTAIRQMFPTAANNDKIADIVAVFASEIDRAETAQDALGNSIIQAAHLLEHLNVAETLGANLRSDRSKHIQ